MSLVQIGAASIFGANLVGYFLYWGDQLTQIDKLLWMVLMAVIFSLEAVAEMLKGVMEDEDDN